MTNVEKLFLYLDTHGLRLGGLTPGPDATSEDVAEAILLSLYELEKKRLLDKEETNVQ